MNDKEAISKVKLDNESWESLQKDFLDGEVKSIICAKYQLKGYQFKALKRYFLGK